MRRRRECTACVRRFTTYERATELPLLVIKKDGRREAFDQQKIIMGMVRACEKRPVSRDVIEQTAAAVEREIRDELAEEIPAEQVGLLVMERLREMDEVAYVRFASVYKEFHDADSFLEEIETLAPKTPTPVKEDRTGQPALFDSPE